MKKKITSLVIFITLLSATYAQDVIVTKDAKKINAKVTEVNIDNVRYINFDNLEGPVYTISKSDIHVIIYQNGLVDIFETENSENVEIATSQDKTITIASSHNEIIVNEDPFITKSPKELLVEMSANNPALYASYLSANQKATNGGILIGLGAISTMLGIGMFATADASNVGDRVLMGYTSLFMGEVFFGVGIPIRIVGVQRRNRILKNYSQEQNSAFSSDKQIRFQLSPYKLGLAFVF
ncbi:MAG: hypothetical protein FWH18_12670 [Marinilabiliaceae bacterium]|nr:hypothetical protein [Marinilabiliaceae bacterium]